MANRAAFESLNDSMILEIVEMRITFSNIESIKAIKIEDEIIRKKTMIPFYKKKIKSKIIKVIVDEGLFVAESLVGDIDSDFNEIFSDLRFNGFDYRYEIVYV